MVSPHCLIQKKPLSSAAKKAIDLQCDRFEADWKRGRPADIDHYLAEWAAKEDLLVRSRLLRELVPIDLEYRWRMLADLAGRGSRPAIARQSPDRIACANGLPNRPLVEDYYDRFPLLHIVSRAQLHLVVAEYRVRAAVG